MSLPDIDEAVDRLLAYVGSLPGAWPMTGGVITIASRDRVLAVRPFGLAGPGATSRVNPDHLFEIGSISKIFTGLLVLSLVDDGRCDLDAPVTRYLPWLEVGSDHPPFTIRHLLHHTSGLVKGADDPPDELGQCWSLRKTRTGSPPGSVFHYSNLGYVLLGLVIKAVSGIPAPDLCRAMLLEPLGMATAIARVKNRHRPLLAIGCVPATDDQPWLPGTPVAPAPWLEVEACDGNIAASGQDMASFLRMLLGRGGKDGRQIVSPASFDALTGDLAIGGEDWTDGFGATPVTASRYGLGINVETIGENRCLTHGGGMIGYSSFVLADLSADIAIAVLTNANGDYPVGQAIARLGHSLLTDPIAHVPSLDLRLTIASPGFMPEMLGTFFGTDEAGNRVEVTVTQRDGRVAFSSGTVTGQIFRTWSSRLATDHPDFRRFHLTFCLSAQGPAWTYGGMVMRAQQSPTFPESRDIERLRPHVGRYRSYSPWFPTFRIVLRGKNLVLIAAGGVEAPNEDVELVELAPGVFRIGRNETQPERLTMGPQVDGQTILIVRDGCRYSRMSTD